MKVTCVLGSPRLTSNSTAIADHLLVRLQDRGADIKRFYLNNLRYRGCQGCQACKGSSERCILQDDLSPALERLYATDLLILSSPVYYGDVTSQMKGFIDRGYSLYRPGFQTAEDKSRLAPGKKLLFILTQGNPDEQMFADIAARYFVFFRAHGFQEVPAIRCCGISPDRDVTERRDLFRKVDMLAEQLWM